MGAARLRLVPVLRRTERMMDRCALVVLVAVVAACGDGNGLQSRLGSTPPPIADAASAEPVPTTAVPPTQPITAPPTSRLEPSGPAVGDAVAFGAPDASLLPASPPEAFDWGSVGPGWLLIEHPPGGIFSDPVTLDERGLYLVSPDDVVYAVSALPTDGSRIATVSQDARPVLLERYDPVCADGCTCAGGAIWVSATWSTVDYLVDRIRRGRVEISSGSWTTILDEPVEVDEAAPPSTWAISFVGLEDGRIVTATGAGARLRRPDGTPTRELAAPPSPCELLRVWDAEHVLARCAVPPGAYPAPPEVAAEDCHTSGLWLLALDGSPAQPLAIPLDEDGNLSCWAGYADAQPLDDWLAVSCRERGTTASWPQQRRLLRQSSAGST